MYSHLFSREQGRTDEAVECTEGSVIPWFETGHPACWSLLGVLELSSLLSAVMEKILAIGKHSSQGYCILVLEAL